MSNGFDREVEMLENDLEAGRISMKEYNEELREMRYSYQANAEESAQEAYQDELSRW